MMDPEEMRRKLTRVEEDLKGLETRLDLYGQPCARCSRKDGDRVTLAGGYETVLCRTCRNDWAVAADESGHWLAYRKAVAAVKVVRECVKAAIHAGMPPHSDQAVVDAVGERVEQLVAAERTLFQFAVKWMASGEAA